MSTLDREPRTISGGKNSPLYEPRVDPGANRLNPERLGPQSPRMATIPRGQAMTSAEKYMPVKR